MVIGEVGDLLLSLDRPMAHALLEMLDGREGWIGYGEGSKESVQVALKNLGKQAPDAYPTRSTPRRRRSRARRPPALHTPLVSAPRLASRALEG